MAKPKVEKYGLDKCLEMYENHIRGDPVLFKPWQNWRGRRLVVGANLRPVMETFSSRYLNKQKFLFIHDYMTGKP